MKLHEIKAPKIKTGSPSTLGVSAVFRTEKPEEYYKGKGIWGKGKYFSLTRADSEKVNAGTDEDIKEFILPNDLNLMDFDLTWGRDTGKDEDRVRSNFDFEQIHILIDNAPSGIDGFVVRSHSMQYGYSQVVIFPHAVKKVK